MRQQQTQLLDMQAEFNAINDLYESMHNTEIRILIEENGLKRMNPFQAYLHRDLKREK